MLASSPPSYSRDRTPGSPPDYEEVGCAEETHRGLEQMWRKSRFHGAATLLVPKVPPAHLLDLCRRVASPHEIRVGVEICWDRGMLPWHADCLPDESEELVFYSYGLRKNSAAAIVLAELIAPIRLIFLQARKESCGANAGSEPFEEPYYLPGFAVTASHELMRCNSKVQLEGHEFDVDFSLAYPKSICFNRAFCGFNYVRNSIKPLESQPLADSRTLEQERVILVLGDRARNQPRVMHETPNLSTTLQARSFVSKCGLALCRFASDVLLAANQWLQHQSPCASISLATRSQEIAYGSVLGVPSVAVELTSAQHRRRHVQIGRHTTHARGEDEDQLGHKYALVTRLLTNDTCAVHSINLVDRVHTSAPDSLGAAASHSMTSWNWATAHWEFAERHYSIGDVGHSRYHYYTLPTFRKVVKPLVPYADLLGYRRYSAAPSIR